MVIKYLIYLILFEFSHAYKILLAFSAPSPSHGILSEGYARHLLAAGHEVTYMSPYPIKNPPKNLRNLDVSENIKYINIDVFDIDMIMRNEFDTQDQIGLIKMMDTLWMGTAQLEVVQNLMNDPNEKFDVVVAELLFTELIAGLATVFDCPLVWVGPMETHSWLLYLIHEPLNPAYTIHVTSKDDSLSFPGRVYQLWSLLSVWCFKWLNADRYNEDFKQLYGSIVAKKGRELPNFEDVKFNASLMLGNSDIASGDAIALPQNYKHVGGFHIKDTADDLPKNLQKFMDNAKNGVIYFSLGSNVKSKNIPDYMKRELLRVFSELKENVIWKLEKPIPGLPKNVQIVSWAPQQSILAHSKCVLFITHGGQLSTLETLHAGKPIIGIPLFVDQYYNVNRAVKKGFGIRVDFDKNLAQNVKAAIKQILENRSYQRRASELSLVFRDRIVPPGKELVHWIEHVIKTNGAPHLHSVALHVSWHKKLYLDLLLVILLALISLFVIGTCLFVCMRTGTPPKKKAQ